MEIEKEKYLIKKKGGISVGTTHIPHIGVHIISFTTN